MSTHTLSKTCVDISAKENTFVLRLGLRVMFWSDFRRLYSASALAISMGLFKFNWLKRLVRRHSTPIPYRKANRWRNTISVGYLLVCWNLFGYISRYHGFQKSHHLTKCLWFFSFAVYTASQGGFDKEKLGLEKDPFDDLSPAERFAVRSGVKQAKIVRKGEEVIIYKKENYQEFVDRFDPTKQRKSIKEDYNDPDNLYEIHDAADNVTETK